LYQEIQKYQLFVLYLPPGHEPLIFFKEMRQELYHRVLPRLQNHLWIVTESNCPPLSSLFLDIIAEFIFGIKNPNRSLSDVLAELSSLSSTPLHSLIENALRISRGVLQQSKTIESTAFYNQIMIHKLRKVAAKICLHFCFADPNEYRRILSESATDLLVSLLSDYTYEVRILTLKFLVQFLSHHNISTIEKLFDSRLIQLLLLYRIGLSFSHTNQLLSQRLLSSSPEDNPKCVSYMLKLLSLLPVLLPEDVFQNLFTTKSALDTQTTSHHQTDLWMKLSEWAHSKAFISIKQGLLFMGTFIHQFCEYVKRVESDTRTLDNTKVSSMFTEWLNLCTNYSAIHQVHSHLMSHIFLQ
jgi:hypothetical protein